MGNKDGTPIDEPANPEEGSAAALCVLGAMNKWKGPVMIEDLCVLTSLSRRTVTSALVGLQHRGRVVKYSDHNGPNQYELAHLQHLCARPVGAAC